MRFGKIELDVPEGWFDRTPITLVKPAEEKMKSAKVQEMASNFVMTRVPADGTFNAEDVAAAQLAGMQATFADLRVVSQGTLEIGSHEAVTREVRFLSIEQGLVQQLHIFLVTEDEAFTMVGTGSAGRPFEGVREELVGLAQSFRLVS